MSSNEIDKLTVCPSGLLFVPKISLEYKGVSGIYFSLIIPTFNESKNIQNLVALLISLLNDIIPGKYELIIVDGNSPDLAWKTELNLVNEYPQLKVFRRQEERGLSSVIRGWQVSRGEILGVIDGDLQHPPQILRKLLEAIEQGADLAVASRHVEGGGVSDWGFLRRILSRGDQT